MSHQCVIRHHKPPTIGPELLIGAVYGSKIEREMTKPTLKVLNGELVKAGDTAPARARAPLPKTARIKTISDVKRDMLRVYRAGRTGVIDSSEVGRWMYAAGQVGAMMEKADIEPRITAIEARIEALAKKLSV